MTFAVLLANFTLLCGSTCALMSVSQPLTGASLQVLCVA
jgi:hypothetical protein